MVHPAVGVVRSRASWLGPLVLFLASSAASAQVQDLELVHSDSFESGTLNGWAYASSTDGGDLAVSAAAALTGSFGLQAVVDDVTALYALDDSILFGEAFRNENDSYYHVSFRFDPNGFDPGEAQGALRTRIFIAFQEVPQRRLLSVVLRRRAGQFALMARVREDGDRLVDTGFFDITDEPHLIEMVWHRATTPDTHDGMLRLAIDGVAVSQLQGLDNTIGGIDFVRLGAMSLKAGANGTLYWDDYRAYRDARRIREQLVINEVDYDQAGPDTGEFVEIYNRGPGPVDMSKMVLMIIDGAGHGLHGMYGIGWSLLAARNYFVFATEAVSVPQGVPRRDFILSQDNLGNGAPEAVALLYDTAAGCVVLDALSYEGPVSSSTRPTSCGYADYVEGTMLPAHIEDSDLIPGSLVRLPNGSDTDDAATDWSFSTTPTPGRANVP